jgi:hypothetical protein
LYPRGYKRRRTTAPALGIQAHPQGYKTGYGLYPREIRTLYPRGFICICFGENPRTRDFVSPGYNKGGADVRTTALNDFTAWRCRSASMSESGTLWPCGPVGALHTAFVLGGRSRFAGFRPPSSRPAVPPSRRPACRPAVLPAVPSAKCSTCLTEVVGAPRACGRCNYETTPTHPLNSNNPPGKKP